MRSHSLTSLRYRLLARLRHRLGSEAPPLRLAFWDGEVFDFAARPTVTLRLASPRLLRLLATGNIGRLGQAYVAGEPAVDGRVEDVPRVGIALAEAIGKFPR